MSRYCYLLRLRGGLIWDSKFIFHLCCGLCFIEGVKIIDIPRCNITLGILSKILQELWSSLSSNPYNNIEKGNFSQQGGINSLEVISPYDETWFPC